MTSVAVDPLRSSSMFNMGRIQSSPKSHELQVPLRIARSSLWAVCGTRHRQDRSREADVHESCDYASVFSVAV